MEEAAPVDPVMSETSVSLEEEEFASSCRTRLELGFRAEDELRRRLAGISLKNIKIFLIQIFELFPPLLYKTRDNAQLMVTTQAYQNHTYITIVRLPTRLNTADLLYSKELTTAPPTNSRHRTRIKGRLRFLSLHGTNSSRDDVSPDLDMVYQERKARLFNLRYLKGH